MAHEECRIVSPGIVVNPNGTVVVYFLKGSYPLTGSEDVQQQGYPSLSELVHGIQDLEASLLDTGSHVSLTLSQYVKDDPGFATLANAVGRSSGVSLTGQSSPISFV